MEGSLPAPTDSWREYVTALENRLQQLEARLQEFETKLPEQPDALEALPEGLPDTQCSAPISFAGHLRYGGI